MIQTTYDNVWDASAGACGVSHTFEVVVNLACGGPISTGTSYDYQCGGGGGEIEIVAYPNPTVDRLSIEWTSLESENGTILSSTNAFSFTESVSPPKSFQARLYDVMQGVVKTGQSEDGKLVFYTGDLQNGNYYLVVDAGQKMVKKHIQISR